MPDSNPTATNGTRVAMSWTIAVLSCLFGIILLVVGKVTAGIAFVLAALLALPPLASRAGKAGVPKWARIAGILLFCLVAVVSISGTDIPPSNSATGIKFVDQVLSLLGAFWDRIS